MQDEQTGLGPVVAEAAHFQSNRTLFNIDDTAQQQGLDQGHDGLDPYPQVAFGLQTARALGVEDGVGLLLERGMICMVDSKI